MRLADDELGHETSLCCKYRVADCTRRRPVQKHQRRSMVLLNLELLHGVAHEAVAVIEEPFRALVYPEF